MQPDDPATPASYSLPKRHDKVIQPLTGQGSTDAPSATAENPAVTMIRQKLQSLYSEEPSAAEEQQEVAVVPRRSKHQEYMYQLSQSGMPLADIQVKWHEYYAGLSDADKREVWQEFYAAHAQTKQLAQSTDALQATAAAQTQAPSAKDTPEATPNVTTPETETSKQTQTAYVSEITPETTEARTVPELKEQLLAKVAARSKPKRTSRLHSVMFGLATGCIVMVIMLFGFFNERFIAPFMTPSRAVSSTSIIIDPANTAVGSDPLLIIPKINLEVPVVYDVKTIDERDVQEGLERGVVHYVTTSNPGELGNGVIFGHSSNNILNKGKYKFAFVLLKKLENGDTFYIQKDGKRYVYKVYDKTIVPPSEVSVLERNDKPATFTLITCDPPGTNLNRLVVVGEQISPDPGSNVASSAPAKDTPTTPEELPSNSPSLWSRLTSWLRR